MNSNKKSISKRQHYVSNFYLKKFSQDDYFFVIDLKNKEIRKYHKKETEKYCQKKYFNKIESNEIDPEWLEKEFKKFEDNALNAISELENGAEFDGVIKKDILLLAILYYVRHPERRKHWEKTQENINQAVFEIVNDQVLSLPLGSKLNGFEINQELKDAVPYLKIQTEPPTTNQHIALELKYFQENHEILMERNWILLHANAENDFITTDNPVMLFWKDSNHPPHSPGLRSRNTQIIFPLTKKLLLVGDFEMSNGVDVVTHQEIARLNHTISLNAERFVFSASQNFDFVSKINGKLMTLEEDLYHFLIPEETT